MMLKCCDGKARAEMHEQTLAKLISVASNLAVSAVMINQNQYSPMQAATKLQSAIQLFDILGHHRTIVSAAFAQSFAPSVQL